MASPSASIKWWYNRSKEHNASFGKDTTHIYQQQVDPGTITTQAGTRVIIHLVVAGGGGSGTGGY